MLIYLKESRLLVDEIKNCYYNKNFTLTVPLQIRKIKLQLNYILHTLPIFNHSTLAHYVKFRLLAKWGLIYRRSRSLMS